MDCDFRHQESVLTLRACSLHALLQHSIHCASRDCTQATPLLASETNRLHSGLGEMLLSQAELGREAGCFQASCQGELFNHVTSMWLFRLQSGLCSPSNISLSLRKTWVLFCFLHPPFAGPASWRKPSWAGLGTRVPGACFFSRIFCTALKMFVTACNRNIHVPFSDSLLCTCTSLQMDSPPPEAAALYPSALSLYGSWLAESRSENPSIIMSDFMEKVRLMHSLLVPMPKCF